MCCYMPNFLERSFGFFVAVQRTILSILSGTNSFWYQASINVVAKCIGQFLES